jgi:hypothetical protein
MKMTGLQFSAATTMQFSIGVDTPPVLAGSGFPLGCNGGSSGLWLPPVVAGRSDFFAAVAVGHLWAPKSRSWHQCGPYATLARRRERRASLVRTAPAAFPSATGYVKTAPRGSPSTCSRL